MDTNESTMKTGVPQVRPRVRLFSLVSGVEPGRGIEPRAYSLRGFQSSRRIIAAGITALTSVYVDFAEPGARAKPPS